MADWGTLAGLISPAIINATVNLPYGKSIVVPLGTLSYHEWTLLGLEVEEPPIPRTLVNAKGEKLPNRDDMSYQRKLQIATEERNYRRLAKALEKGGVVVPGATSGEKAQTIRSTIDAGIAVALLTVLANAVYGGKAELLAQADTFRPRNDAAGEGAETPPPEFK